MSEKEIQLLLTAAQQLKIDPNSLQVKNPFLLQGTTAVSMQTAIAELDPAQAARWRLEAGESLSLGAAAAKAGLAPMTKEAFDNLAQMDPDFLTGVEESRARREADLLKGMEEAASEMAAKREAQQEAFRRQAGNNNAMGQHNAAFLRQIGGVQGMQRPARRLTEGR